MIKLKWKCPDCKHIQTYEENTNLPFCINEVLDIKCEKCNHKFEFTFNRI